MAQGKQILQRGHELFGGEIFAPLIGEYASIAKADLKEIGFVRWCIAAEARLRADGFRLVCQGPVTIAKRQLLQPNIPFAHQEICGRWIG